MENQSKRLPYWDNLKGILILLVIAGHLFQLLPNGSDSAAYKLIYLFHMPLFVFCSGYLATYAPKKILKGLLVPYVILQLCCCLCTGQPIQLTTPYWMLWYLPALAVWRIGIPFLELAGKKSAAAMVLLLLVLSLLIGLDDTVGYYAALSRIFVFAPYFAAGYYAKRHRWFHPEDVLPVPAKSLCALAALIVAVVFIIVSPDIRAEWLYGSYGYASGGYSLLVRLVQYAAAAVVGLALLLFTPKNATCFSAWGCESFTLYIAHIALLPAIQNILPIFSRPLQYAVCILSAAAFCLVIPPIKIQILRRLLLHRK